ncbi:MAG: flagellar biosynthetic protein FliO [Thermodesulfobacteriota bacterium]
MRRPTTIGAALALAWAGPALAAEGEQIAQPPDLAGGVGQMLLALGLVLALVLLLYWLARRFLPGHAGLGQAAGLRVLGRLALGPKKGLALVEVGRRVLVVGLAEQGVSLLTTIDDPEEIAALGAAKGGFGQALQRAAKAQEDGR